MVSNLNNHLNILLLSFKDQYNKNLRYLYSPISEEVDRINGLSQIIHNKTGSEINLQGNFKDGKLNGEGKITFEILNRYFEWKGEFENNFLTEGELLVTQKLPSKKEATRYYAKGVFLDNNLNGQGKIILPNGDLQEGEFKKGKLNGIGKITSSNGNLAEGEFKEGKLNGIGKIIWLADRNYCRDDLTESQKKGKEPTCLDHWLLFQEGQFKEGKLNGIGEVINVTLKSEVRKIWLPENCKNMSKSEKNEISKFNQQATRDWMEKNAWNNEEVKKKGTIERGIFENGNLIEQRQEVQRKIKRSASPKAKIQKLI